MFDKTQHIKLHQTFHSCAYLKLQIKYHTHPIPVVIWNQYCISFYISIKWYKIIEKRSILSLTIIINKEYIVINKCYLHLALTNLKRIEWSQVIASFDSLIDGLR